MKRGITVFVTVMLCLAGPYTARATTQVDSLIEKLVDKGILTKQEAIKLKGDIASDEKVAREEGFKQSLPDWVQKMKLSGDLRLRYQYDLRKNSSNAPSVTRTRGRLRFRMGVETKINDQIKVATGIASGSADPRSTNATFENSFEKPDIRLDYGYAEYAPAPWVKMVGGKFIFKDYLWETTDMLWDTDINPQGASIHFEKDILTSNRWGKLTPFLNGGVWTVDESSSSHDDPTMHYAQPGFKWTQTSGANALDATFAGIYYGFTGVQGSLLDNSSCTNSGLTLVGSTCTGTLTHDFDSIGGSAEIGIQDPFGIPVQRIAIFGDYIRNFDLNDDNIGWSAGFKIGDKKVVGPRTWQVKYIYARLQKDAFPDTFPDSDRYTGFTDVESHEALFEYGLTKNVSLGLDYYHSMRMKARELPEDEFQGDVVFKF